jgi:hypothetical protein
MSRVVIISGTEGDRKFFDHYDCESSPPEDSVTLVDWESLLAERKARKQSAGRSVTRARKKEQRAK